MKNLSLRKRAGGALVVLALAGSIVGIAGCDDDKSDSFATSPSAVSRRNASGASVQNGSALSSEKTPTASLRIVSPGRFQNSLTFSPFPVLTSFPGLDCSVIFSPSFDLVIGASAFDLTMQSVAFRMLDGTTLSGPSVTIPFPQLSTQFGNTLIRANTSRLFAIDPVFACTPQRPTTVVATTSLVDRRGVVQTLSVTTNVR